MSDDNQVYFPLTGDESHGFICVRLFSEAGVTKAEASVEGEMTSSADYSGMPISGEAVEVLRDAGDFAAVRGLDMRVKLDGVEWDPKLGKLVG